MNTIWRFALGVGFVFAVNYFIWDIPARASVRRAGRAQ